MTTRNACMPAAVLLILTTIFCGAWRLQAAEPAATTQPSQPIDFDRARQLIQKKKAGQTLTADEEAYVQEAQRQRQGQGQRRGSREGAAGGEKLKATESTGMTPVIDMTKAEKYKGQTGGLYGEGQNQPPPAHRALAEKALAAIRPLDAAGKPAADGKIVLISVGMSNTTREFAYFKKVADADKDKSPRLVIVDCAQGGCDATEWVDPGSSRYKQVWPTVAQRLSAAGVAPQQVQVAWILQALRQPAGIGEFPKHAQALENRLSEIVIRLKAEFPNLQVAYLSSRNYAGYAGSTLNPEPYSYESAFSVRWLIQKQIDGEAKLNGDPSKGKVVAPVLLWGPYTWADGLKGRKADSLIYERGDFASDGTHPEVSGQRKVTELLLKFFKTDPMAGRWFTGATAK